MSGGGRTGKVRKTGNGTKREKNTGRKLDGEAEKEVEDDEDNKA